jgi:hypothetical protein
MKQIIEQFKKKWDWRRMDEHSDWNDMFVEVESIAKQSFDLGLATGKAENKDWFKDVRNHTIAFIQTATENELMQALKEADIDFYSKIKDTVFSKPQTESCKWTIDDKEENYNTDCKEHISVLALMGLTDSFKFCPFCKLPISIEGE